MFFFVAPDAGRGGDQSRRDKGNPQPGENILSKKKKKTTTTTAQKGVQKFKYQRVNGFREKVKEREKIKKKKTTQNESNKNQKKNKGENLCSEKKKTSKTVQC
eukprot:TRINITY_DN1424_c1_g1_i3.p2 TRINITY_DN1424_c1_g1~~TRINITY_DN1424_c1_g1_i3.p2  ORF type:complete len:103 (+),score=6.96 TRINITY_DN1424_c1_g1_i3:227-535(+)